MSAANGFIGTTDHLGAPPALPAGLFSSGGACGLLSGKPGRERPMNDTPEAATAANLAAARRYLDAWLAGDFPAMMATYADGFVLRWFGDNPFAKTYRGRAEAVPALMAFTQRTQRRLLEIVDVTAGPARAVVVVREAIIVNGVEHEIERALVYRVEAGLLAECWVYDQDQRLIDAALSS